MDKDQITAAEKLPVDSASVESRTLKTPIQYTPEEEKALVRRLDWYILPGLSVLYLLCFLDRA